MAKKKHSRLYEGGDQFYEHKEIGGKVIAVLPHEGRQYLLVHREDEDDDTFTLYYQDLRHKVLPALTRRWPGVILEKILEVLREYRRQPRKPQRRQRRRRAVEEVEPTPTPTRVSRQDEVRSDREGSEKPATSHEGGVSNRHIGLWL